MKLSKVQLHVMKRLAQADARLMWAWKGGAPEHGGHPAWKLDNEFIHESTFSALRRRGLIESVGNTSGGRMFAYITAKGRLTVEEKSDTIES